MKSHFQSLDLENHMVVGNPDGRPKEEELECPRCKRIVYDLIDHDYSVIYQIKNNMTIAPHTESFCEDCIKLMTNYFMCKNHDCGNEFIHIGIAKECPECKCKELWGDNPEMNKLIKKVNK